MVKFVASGFCVCMCVYECVCVLKKLTVTLGMHMVKYGCDLLGPGTLKSALSQEWMNVSMNWAYFLHTGSDAIITC